MGGGISNLKNSLLGETQIALVVEAPPSPDPSLRGGKRCPYNGICALRAGQVLIPTDTVSSPRDGSHSSGGTM